jgi:ABC-type antimicrobial peptide transport system permease subunit
VRRHFETAQFEQAETAVGAIGGIQLVDTEFRAVRVARYIDKQIAQRPVDHPRRQLRAFTPADAIQLMLDLGERDFENGKNTGGFIKYVRMFGILGFIVLLIACINFMNLSTARSEKRAKEVGVRKAIGAGRKRLIGQFLGESLLIAGIAFLLALVLVVVSLPHFNKLTDKDMSLQVTKPLFWGVMLLFTVLTGLLAGSYPAFYLSSFNPVRVLKGHLRAGKSS